MKQGEQHTMKEHLTIGKRSGRGMMALVAALVATTVVEAATVSWKVRITPAGGGSVVYQSSSPVKAGTLTTSGSLTFNLNAYVDLTFVAANGYRMVSVYKDTDNLTPWLDAAKHSRFGPVTHNHTIDVKFEQINPTGAFTLTFPATPPAGLASIYDITGRYLGTVPKLDIMPLGLSQTRAYDFAAAMDDSGKVDALGTVAGLSVLTGATLHATGKVATVKDVPVATVTVQGAGTCQSVPVSGSGSMVGPAVPVMVNGDEVLQGLGSYTGKVAGITVKAKKNIPVSVPVSIAANREWSMTVTFTEKTVTQGSKQVKLLTAKASLVRPDGDQIDFAERTVVYSPKTGCTLTFTKGIKHGTLVVDKTTSVTLTKMMLTLTGANWAVTGGDITYAFLGQKGKGKLVDFVDL